MEDVNKYKRKEFGRKNQGPRGGMDTGNEGGEVIVHFFDLHKSVDGSHTETGSDGEQQESGRKQELDVKI